MSRKEVYVLLPNLWGRAQKSGHSSSTVPDEPYHQVRQRHERPTSSAGDCSKRGKRKLGSTQPTRSSKRLKSESPQTWTDSDEAHPTDFEEESDAALPSSPSALPASTSRSPLKLILRLPRRRLSSSTEVSEYDGAQPSRSETPAAASPECSSGKRRIRRVRLIVRPPRSPSPDFGEDDDTLSSDSESQANDAQNTGIDDCLKWRNSNSKSPFVTPSWLGGDVFDSPSTSDFGGDTKQEELTENCDSMREEKLQEHEEEDSFPRFPIAAALDRPLAPGLCTANRQCSPPTRASSAESTPQLAHGSISTASDTDSEFEVELMYPEETTPPSSPKAERLVHWFDFERYGNMIPGC